MLLESAAGPSGANLLGACCRGDGQLLARLSEHLRAEEAVRPGAVFAELIYLPEAGTGDWMVRPVLRDYEIPILGRSGCGWAPQPGLQKKHTSMTPAQIGPAQ